MKYRTRTNFTAADKALMWDRWQQGGSLQAIAQLFDRTHGSVAGILARSSGIRPPDRKRSRWALTRSEREEISRGVVAGQSIRAIASSQGRAAKSWLRWREPSSPQMSANLPSPTLPMRRDWRESATIGAYLGHSAAPLWHPDHGRHISILKFLKW